jgi:transposase-like protein
VGKRRDEAKARFWQGAIREAARSGVSIREFCRLRKLDVAQFYWWRRRLKQTRPPRTMGTPEGGQARFALVGEGAETTDAGIELVLGDGRRLRIGRGVDEATLRSVLAVVQGQGC